MDLNSAETHELLRQAREKAEKLLNDLKAKQIDLDANPPEIAPEDLVQGRAALANAIASAERMLKSLNEAQRIASVETN